MINLIKIFVCLCMLVFPSILVAQSANVFLNRDYWTANPTIEAIEKNIAKGHSISELNRHAFDAVSWALIEQADNKTVKYLLSKKGNDVNKLTHDARTYIFWAAYKSNLEMMQYLVNKGAKTDVIDSHGYSVLNFAAVTGQLDPAVYDFCIDHGAKISEDKNHDGANALLLVAPFLKDTKLIDYFVSKGLDLKSTDNNGHGIFNYASKKGNIKLMDALIKKGIPYKTVTKTNSNAMILASRGLRGKSNPLEVYQYLEKKGIEPNITTKEGVTPLHAIAMYNKDINVFKYFLTKGVAINQTNKSGASALTNAILRNTPETVNFLLEQGADASIVDTKGNNLAFYLLQSFNTKKPEDFHKKLKALTKNGLDIKQNQKDGNSLFHLALDANSVDLLKEVQALGVAVNTKNKNGLTPLHKAAMKAKNTEALKYLLSIGADKSITTDFDETVYDLAMENEIFQKKHIDLAFLK